LIKRDGKVTYNFKQSFLFQIKFFWTFY